MKFTKYPIYIYIEREREREREYILKRDSQEAQPIWKETKTYWASYCKFLSASSWIFWCFFEEHGPTTEGSGKSAGTNPHCKLTALDEGCALINWVDGSGGGTLSSVWTCVLEEALGIATSMAYTLGSWGITLILAWLLSNAA